MTLQSQLLRDDLSRILKFGTRGGETAEFSIFSNSSLQEGYGTERQIGHENSTVYARNHQNHHEIFIESVFERLDPLIDLDFVQGKETGNSDINIYRVWYNSLWDEIDLLNNNASSLTGGGTAHYDSDNCDIAWKDYYGDDEFSVYEKSTIVHEIGHALGLSDLAYDNRWNSYDSMMSYNHPEGLPPNTWFAEADIAAFQTIWGVEDDHIVYRLTSPSTGTFLFSTNSQEINIITGQGWINEGIAYHCSESGGTPLYRFNMGSGKFFYTANEAERDSVRTSIYMNLINGYYEGPAFNVYSIDDKPSDALPVYRYLNSDNNSHLYSSSPYEQSILNASSGWTNEGIAWYGESI